MSPHRDETLARGFLFDMDGTLLGQSCQVPLRSHSSQPRFDPSSRSDMARILGQTWSESDRSSVEYVTGLPADRVCGD